MQSIYNYTDYRSFLKEYYEYRKANEPKYSHRTMASQMGFTSPNYLKLVMDGDRNLGQGSLDQVIKGLGLKKKESEYFSYLVFFSQAKNGVQKNYYFGLMAKFRTKSNVTQLNVDQFEYYNKWYNAVVRELVVGKPEDLDFKELANQVIPPILPKEVKQSIGLLERLGLIELKNGVYKQSSRLISTAQELQTLSVRNFHQKMCEIAKESIEKVEPAERDFSSVTVNISQNTLTKLKKRIADFRDELMQVVEDDEGVEQVFQCSIQLFPLSKRKKNPKK